MGRHLRLAILTSTLLLVLAGCTTPTPTENNPASALAAPRAAEGASRTIAVSGVGTIRVAPDVAFVTLGVETRAETAREAQEANAATMTNVLDAIKARNVPESAIQTRGLSLAPIVEAEGEVTGFVAQNHVVVRLTDIARVGEVVDAAVGAGANAAGGVRFGLADEAAAVQRALDAAARDARGKADAVAKAIGVELSAVESVVEETSVSPLTAEADSRAAATAPTPVEPGELDVTARLRVVYAY